MSKYFPLFLLAIIFLGAGCVGIGGKTSQKADGGVYKTADAGATWAQTVSFPTAKAVGSIAKTNVLVVRRDAADSESMYIGTRENGMFFSYDNGATWQQSRVAALKEGRVDDIAVDPKNKCVIYVVKGQRLFKSSDCSRTYSDEAYVETRQGVALKAVVVDWFDTRIVWMGLSNGDVLKSVDAAKTWQRSMNSKTSANAMLVSQTDSRIVLVATANNGFYRTTNSGKTWTNIEKELKKFSGSDKVSELSQDKRSQVVVAATKYGLLRSFDMGATWEPAPMLTAPGQVAVRAIAVNPDDGTRMAYAAASTFYSTVDGGKNWTTKAAPSVRPVESMAIDPKNPSVIFVGVVAPEKKK